MTNAEELQTVRILWNSQMNKNVLIENLEEDASRAFLLMKKKRSSLTISKTIFTNTIAGKRPCERLESTNVINKSSLRRKIFHLAGGCQNNSSCCGRVLHLHTGIIIRIWILLHKLMKQLTYREAKAPQAGDRIKQTGFVIEREKRGKIWRTWEPTLQLNFGNVASRQTWCCSSSFPCFPALCNVIWMSDESCHESEKFDSKLFVVLVSPNKVMLVTAT